jgi:hypothetical protein
MRVVVMTSLLGLILLGYGPASAEVRDHRSTSPTRAQNPSSAQGGVVVTPGAKRRSSTSNSTCIKFVFTSKGKTCVHY